jgi:glyoxylase-like metal-dependent hydrolase (beta-lactamase superfamily II)
MTASTSFRLGRFDATIISAGTFALDGGAMFGIIPKPLWEKKIPPDEQNRIPMATNCLLLQDGKQTVLIDCGMGTKWADKQAAQFKVETTLEQNLQAVGVAPADITDLVLTHLHFDHAGGVTSLGAGGALRLVFDNARVHVGRRNWEWAHDPNERDRGSYRADSFSPLAGSARDRLVLIDDVQKEAEILPGMRAFFCEGHTTGQMLPLVGDGDQRLLYGADMIPTRAHVRMPWIMGYDLRPIELLDEKRRLLTLCAQDGVALLYEHDTVVATSGIAADGSDFQPTAAPNFIPAAASAGGHHG